jgi:hypothetical protein
MKPQSKIVRRSREAFVAFSGMALAIGLIPFLTHADQWDKKTTLTIDQPMQVRDTYLEPGQYVFKLVDSSSDRHIVQIFNADQSHLINTIMAIPDYRVQVTSKSRFEMWETPAGSVKALKAWYYPGDNFGQEFPYPKNLRQIAALEPAAAPPQFQTRPAEPAPPEPAVQPQAFAPEPPSRQEPQEIAQNSPPPPPPATAAPPEPPASTPAELPKTASPYPLFGFTGLLLLGLGALVRQTRSA